MPITYLLTIIGIFPHCAEGLFDSMFYFVVIGVCSCEFECVHEFSFFWLLIMWDYFTLIVCMDVVKHLTLEFLCIFCRFISLDRFWLNMMLSWNISISPSIVIQSFAACSNLDWHLWSFRVCVTLVQALLSFRVFVEKLGVLLGMVVCSLNSSTH